MKKTIRIKDIAQMAQVSMGTVDRVIHNRGKVSAFAKEKVMRVLDQIDYKPNLIAKTLSAAKTYKMAVLLPDPELDAYWRKTAIGIQKAEAQLSQFGTEVYLFPFNPFQSSSFRDEAKQVIDFAPDGVLLAPILRQESLDFARHCQTRQIPLVCFNTYIEALQPLSFIGQDLHQSGRLAAELMCMGSMSGIILIIHIAEKAQNSVHLYEKEQGFREFIQQHHCQQVKVITVQLESPDDRRFKKTLDQALTRYPQTCGLFVTTSKAYNIASLLESAGRTDMRLIGYDLIDDNLPYLRKGVIDILIHQNARRQSFLGISYLTDHLVFKKSIPSLQHLPLSIISRENLDSYLHSDMD